MDNTNHDLPISAAKSLTNIIFLVDTSGSMSGEKIAAINTALQDSVPFIREFGQEDESVKIQCSVLYFNKYADWATKGVDINNFCWPNLESCEGSARLDLAYMELFLKLTRKQGGLMDPQGHGQHVPIIILVIGSHVIGNIDTAFAVLKHNMWFRRSIKIAIFIPTLTPDTTYQYLRKFTGDDDNIISIDKFPDILKSILKNILLPSFGGDSNGIGEIYESYPLSAEDEDIDDCNDINWEDLEDF